MSDSVTPENVACQALLSMGFSRQEYWNELLFPTPGIFPMQEMEPASVPSPALAGGFFTTCVTWEAQKVNNCLVSSDWANSQGCSFWKFIFFVCLFACLFVSNWIGLHTRKDRHLN